MRRYSFTLSFFISLGIILLGFFCLSLKLYDIQIVHGEYFRNKAKNIYTITVNDIGSRGKITDSQGNILAGSQTYYDLFLDFRQISESHNSEYIQQALLDKTQLNRRKLDSYFYEDSGKLRTRGERRILSQLTLDQCIEIQEYLKTLIQKAQKEQREGNRVRKIIRNKGLVRREISCRFYPHGNLLSAILGYVDYNGHGIEGIEKTFDAFLQPSGITKKYERSAKGERFTEAFSEVGVKKDGNIVQLTINSDLQRIAENAIRDSIEELGPDAVIVLMADPKTGAILAAAQYPNFDPNDRSTLNSTRDLISQFQYEPGSMMKGITVAIALDEGVVTMNTKIDCNDNSGLRGMRDSHNIGTASVYKIIQESSNIGSARACLCLSPEVFYKRLSDFGLGEIVGVGLPNEYNGTLRPPERWSGPDQSRIAIGYATAITPLQLVQAYCAIANGGILMKLRLFEAIRDGQTKEIIHYNYPQKIRRVLSTRTSREMCSALQSVVEEGTGKKSQVEGYDVAGKTGTARKATGGSYASATGRIAYYGSFIGFLPANDPQIVILVTVDNAKSSRSYYGGTNAGPIFRKIAEKTMHYMRIPKNK